MSVEKMNEYSVRKAYRKQKKSVNILFKETGIECSDDPTKNLLIGNAGLVTGLQQEILLEICLPYGLIDNIIMVPGKSYCFVVFHETKSAAKAYTELHGKRQLMPDSGPLYLAFAVQAPMVADIWNNFKPPGLILVEDFVTKSEEEILLNCVDWKTTESHTGQSLKHRQVKHYGYEFQYGINNVNKSCPLPQNVPSECCLVFDRLREMDLNIPTSDPDQLTVNQYQPGQGIPPHVDTHSAFEDPLISLSLGSAVVMDFRHRDGRNIPVVLPQRSILIMSGESRYDWSHGITPRKMDVVSAPGGVGLTIQNRGVRTSFTFRWVRRKESCDCDYHMECDSHLKNNKSSNDITSNEMAEKLETLHVHKVYEEIASHFSDTRHKPWPNVLSFVQELMAGAVLVDVGCGNGKYFGHNPNIYEIGCDYSCSLAKVCQERGFQIFNCDCLSIPLRSGIADGCISIAVIHHLATKERRLKAVEEIVRILKVHGKALIYVWAKDQERHKKQSSYLKQDRKNRNTPIHMDVNRPAEEVQVKCEQFQSMRKMKNQLQKNTSSISSDESLVNRTPQVKEMQLTDNNQVCEYHAKIHPNASSQTCSVECAVNSNLSLVSTCSHLDCNVEKEMNHKCYKSESQSGESCSSGSEVINSTENIPSLPLHKNRTQFLYQDLLVPWKLHPRKKTSDPVENINIFYRYYHVFEDEELEQLCAQVQNAKVVKSYYDQGNWCVILQKTEL